MNRRGNAVVTALTSVNVIIRTDCFLQGAPGQCGQNFVGIHIGAGAGTGLKYVQRKMLHHVRALQQRLCGLFNGGGDIFIQFTQLAVGAGCGGFYQQQCTDKRLRQSLTTDRKIINRALSLGTVQGISRYL